MPGYTNVPKPTGANYTNQNPVGKEQFDDKSVSYDSLTFYDGVNQGAYTNISKPNTIYTWNSLTVSWSSFPNPWESPNWTPISKPT